MAEEASASAAATPGQQRRFKTVSQPVRWGVLLALAFSVVAVVGLGRGITLSATASLRPAALRASVQSVLSARLPATTTSGPLELAALPPEFAKVIPATLRTPDIYAGELNPEPRDLAAAKCRRLFEDYPQEHSAVLQLPREDPKRRLAVFKKGRGTKLETGGVGDFGGGMVGTLLFALLTGRAYELYWPVSYMAVHSPWIVTNYTENEEYLDMPNPPGFGLGACCDVQVTPDGRAQHVIMVAGGGDPHWNFFKERSTDGSFEGHFNHPIEIFDMNKGMAIHFLADPGSWIYQGLQRYGLGNFRQAYGCGINFLIQLLPEHTAYIEPLAHLLRSKKTLSICMHVRSGDHYINQPREAYCSADSMFLNTQHVFQCAQQIEDRFLHAGVRPVWYLATDNAGLRIFAKSEYPDKLVYFVKPPNREYSQNRADVSRDDACATSYWWTCMSQVKVDSIVETMEDWHLFSLCDYHIVGQSGFSSSAVGRSMRDGTAYMSSSNIRNVDVAANVTYSYIHSDGKRYVVDCSQPTPPEQVAGVMGGKW